jgi:hypothetical protein
MTKIYCWLPKPKSLILEEWWFSQEGRKGKGFGLFAK